MRLIGAQDQKDSNCSLERSLERKRRWTVSSRVSPNNDNRKSHKKHMPIIGVDFVTHANCTARQLDACL